MFIEKKNVKTLSVVAACPDVRDCAVVSYVSSPFFAFFVLCHLRVVFAFYVSFRECLNLRLESKVKGNLLIEYRIGRHFKCTLTHQRCFLWRSAVFVLVLFMFIFMLSCRGCI